MTFDVLPTTHGPARKYGIGPSYVGGLAQLATLGRLVTTRASMEFAPGVADSEGHQGTFSILDPSERGGQHGFCIQQSFVVCCGWWGRVVFVILIVIFVIS